MSDLFVEQAQKVTSHMEYAAPMSSCDECKKNSYCTVRAKEKVTICCEIPGANDVILAAKFVRYKGIAEVVRMSTSDPQELLDGYCHGLYEKTTGTGKNIARSDAFSMGESIGERANALIKYMAVEQ